MKINPFEHHPDTESLPSRGAKNFLTKKEICDILDKKVVEITNTESPTWGYTKYSLLRVLFTIKTEIEDFE